VVAYSTLSQLGYMTVALGASAYSAGIFHLFTHAFFKALLFLGAGSVIIAMHHDQDMRNMGGLRKYMPITWITSLIGSLALIGFPGFAGFYSKDSIIVAVGASDLWAASFAYPAVLIGVFITALYSFRMYFMVFHGEERMDEHTREHLHETPAVVTVPLILLAIPSVIVGAIFAGPMLLGDHFGDTIHVLPEHNTLQAFAAHWHGALSFALHGFLSLPFLLAFAGVATAWYLYIVRPDLPAVIRERFSFVHSILDRKYGFDEFNQWFFAGGARGVGSALWRFGDAAIIDGLMVNGSAKLVGWVSGIVRHIQSGLLFHYAFAMIIGLTVLIFVFVTR
jgi:NADH-quinone oxidoreductase subunit L